jgi:hypothetical protein
VALALFLIAFVPRLLSAGTYITVDEQRWIERSVDFMYNLSHGDLASIASIHPGVTATWGYGTFLLGRFALEGDLPALYQMRAEENYDIPGLLPTAGLFTALVTSLMVVASYGLLRKLFGQQIALLAALLLALNPYFLAHSRRVHLDAILAGTMFLSALALLVYTTDPPAPLARRYLLLSGVLAGLAWLTKLPALYLVPFALLALAVCLFVSTAGWRPTGSALRRSIIDFFLWAVVACAVFFLLWPSLWVNARQVFAGLAHTLSWGMQGPHTSLLTPDDTPMQFFLGKTVADPGLGYYPLLILFRLSPFTFLFLPVGLAAMVIGLRRPVLRRSALLAAWLGLAYVVFFLIMLSLGAKKLESYALPIFPMLDLLAAVGLWASLQWATRRWQQRRGRDTAPNMAKLVYSLATGILLVSVLWLRLVPYYSSYFNPLLGGTRSAVHLFAFGGGEGLDMAAEYLNQKEDASQLTVATAYPDHVFRHYFEGTTWPLRQGTWTGLWLLADYAISYTSYAQRDLPSAEVVDFFSTLEPEYVATINGVDYARVYQVPPLVSEEIPAISHPASINLADQVDFLGYDLETERVESGGEFGLTLYWQARRPLATDYSLFLRLVNGVYDVWGSQDGSPLWGAMPTSRWQEGMVVADQRRLPVLAGTPPGVYQIELGMYNPSTMDQLAPAGSNTEFLLGPVTVVRASSGAVPELQNPQEANLGDQVRLLGYDLGGQAQPGQILDLTLFWEALVPMQEDYTVFVHLIGEDGQIWGQRDSQPVTGFYPTAQWMPGEFVRDQIHLEIAPAAPAGDYQLVVGMYRPETGDRLPVLDKRNHRVGDSISLDTIRVGEP